MNRAKKSAPARTSLDPVCSTTLLMAMSAERYQRKKEEARKWEEPLTSHGIKLRDGAFNDINYRHYRITIEDATMKWICRVTRLGKGHAEQTCFFLKKLEKGSVFGGCSCGEPYTDGAPCHHMVAVVQSSRIEGLTPTNAMPYWWSTECWRKQFPLENNVTFDTGMEALRATPEDKTMKYFPPYAAARKTRCPKIDKQTKSPLEGREKRKRIDQTVELPTAKKSKTSGDDNRGKGVGGKRSSPD